MKNIEIINASAGTGKTYNLTERVLDKIKAGLPPESLMATTFTVKAANELRERIRLKLLKGGRTEDAQRIMDGFIGTVNSVCARLLAEYAIDAGLSPALDVLPEDDGERLFKIAVSNVIDKHAGKIEPAAVRLERLGGGTIHQKLGDWRDDVQEIVDLARANQLDPDALRKCADKSWESLSDMLGAPSKSDLDRELNGAVKSAISELEKLDLTTQDSKSALDELKKFERKRKTGFPVTWKEWVCLSNLPTGKRDAGGVLDDLNQIAGTVLSHPEFQNDLKIMVAGVFECAAEAINAYETFKRKQGLMDFVDQETKVLDLVRGNKAFQTSLKERLKHLMVDEFQDTSPIQLALFLELNEITGKSTWVGDPKQSIYGFRGTDSQLMDEVAKLITDTKTIRQSWRSREALINFTNAVFSETFHWLDKDKVCLEIPPQRKKKAEGGWIETWNLAVGSFPDEFTAIANGVKNLLSRHAEIRRSDIAILCRKNDHCSEIARGLEKIGIRASAPQGALLETRECQLAMAALRYMNDGRDTVALAEIVHISPLHSCHAKWLECLVKDKDETISQWKSDPMVAALDAMRGRMKHWTPLESLENAIAGVELPRTLKSWTNLNTKMCNLDALRGFCCAYVDQCRARRSAATVAGFISYLNELAPEQAEGAGEQTVHVLTYHGAKGLEWPVVILTGLDSTSRGGAFGIEVVAAPKFNPQKPLADRYIHFWPWPFGSQKSLQALDEILPGRPEEKDAVEKSIMESQRLMYVGMTRARDALVLSMRKKETKKDGLTLNTGWLDELTNASGNTFLKFPAETGKQMVTLGKASIPIDTYEFTADDTGSAHAHEEENYLAALAGKLGDYPPVRVSPSGLTVKDEDLKDIDIQVAADFGQSIKITGKSDMTLLGNAIHGFFAVDTYGLSTVRQTGIASGLLQRWGVEQAISPDDLLAAGNKLKSFIETNYPEAKILRECPISLRNAQNQRVQGWVDIILELPEGYVVIDHKSYSGKNPQEYVKKYVPQLVLYKDAIEKATGKKVIKTLLHLPLLGLVLAVSAVKG
jgi:ATP-dependent exoDNAse (exonuclease V) beta subunit